MGTTHCQSSTANQLSTDEIARRAYELWEARGRPGGDGSQDWDDAVAELTAGRNGHSSGGLRHWWEKMRRSILGGD